jgi:hypothetical protein
MKLRTALIIVLLLFSAKEINAQAIALHKAPLDTCQVTIDLTTIKGKSAIRVVKDSSVKRVDEPTFAKLKFVEFTNGTIEVKVLSRLLPTARPSDRGFIGIAFRINPDNSAFECIYIRPTNGRAEDQVRRNHSIQYFSYPDYKFDRLRKESPEKYESYADMGLDEWITLKMVIQYNQAKLYINNNTQPSLVVNDLKLGDQATGSIGLFVDVGTEGFFRDLKITKAQ